MSLIDFCFFCRFLKRKSEYLNAIETVRKDVEESNRRLERYGNITVDIRASPSLPFSIGLWRDGRSQIHASPTRIRISKPDEDALLKSLHSMYK
jgi:hypothetical protein